MGGGAEGVDLGDLFEGLFGGGGRRSRVTLVTLSWEKKAIGGWRGPVTPPSRWKFAVFSPPEPVAPSRVGNAGRDSEQRRARRRMSCS
jgi:hypothetical protein